MKVISKLSDNHKMLTAEDFVHEYKLWTRDTKLAVIEGLSVLELCLVSISKNRGNFNFEEGL